MPAWFLNPALTRFRNEVNTRWPQRDKTSDGTIGDLAHQATNSDHNPDPDGSVDAWDMDVDGVPVATVIAAALKHEAIQYVIYNRRITSRNQSGGLGVWHPYSGANPHDKHVHFNSRSSHENSTKPWFPPAPPTPPEDDMFEDADRDALTSANFRALGIYQDLDSISYGISNGTTKTEPNKAKLARVALDAKVTALAAAVAGADEAVAAQLQATFAQIDDELAAMQVQIADVDEQVVARLGAGELTAQEKADLLRPVLGDDAAAVGALLAQG